MFILFRNKLSSKCKSTRIRSWVLGINHHAFLLLALGTVGRVSVDCFVYYDTK